MSSVYVACKVPHGLVLRIGNFKEIQHPVLGGGMRLVQEWYPIDKHYTIFGPARAVGQDAKAPVISGFAITKGVDADFMEKWMTDNMELDAVINHQIFFHEKYETLTAKCNEFAKVRSGLEPIVPDADVRVPRNVKTAEGRTM